MVNTNYNFNSVLSLKPLITVLKRMIAEGKLGAKRLYQGIINDIEANPVLLEPIDDETVLQEHYELIETLLSTIFTPSTGAMEGMYAIAFPFRSETVYTSPSFKEQFLPNDSREIVVPDNRTNYSIAKASLNLAYNLIMRKFYSWDVAAIATSVHTFPDKETGLTKYLELRLNAQFVDVNLDNDKFKLPTNYTAQRSLDMDELRKTFPLENFRFEGLVVIDVTDVTSEQVIAEIKNTLLNVNAISDVAVYEQMQTHIQTFLGLKDVTVGITPFIKINDHYIYSEQYYRNSLLFKTHRSQAEKYSITQLAKQIFETTDQPLLYTDLTEQNSKQHELLKYYNEQGARSLILCPLKGNEGELIGLLDITSEQPARLKYNHLVKIHSAMQLFSLALEKNIQSLESQINKTIKEHFTAIQPAVEWLFTEAAFQYLQMMQENDSAKIPSISFEDVYPLYAVIDVRNSSVERNNSIQLDLLEQLQLVHQVLEKAAAILEFPLLKEIRYKVNKYIAASSEQLLSDDELMIYDFLQKDVEELFTHLHLTQPELHKLIDNYRGALDPQKNIVYHHRKKYEDTLTIINNALDRFVDREQAQAQKFYPHYFERYMTDGIEFNIYIGQSMAPNRPFHEMYVGNLKLWQLLMLVKAARLTHALEKRLPLPLQTTQLILAHSIPLSISFRRKERKFDVDGAYNIRYEIVKKRIDKVHLLDSDERLTQPGKIAIVYSQQKELNEYLAYIEYLQSENLLIGDVEHLELEELQGISGLKAIRVDVNLEGDQSPTIAEAAKVAAKTVLRK
ncbi:hypothetical protein [Flavisolibacter tropicus]|uniref:GAF domain-containing protein n=1 Tax=Flavisolibacter tropicus TaxID=1492898 RepID=A0A172TVW8_9BACT|nr:hypothetical protein [Flavisolibacter tropicus]ANE51229.1 hypothetical protein SY85_12640 [Flavisolibacter tropicus]